MALVLDWCKKLGYEKDPFSVEEPVDKIIAGLEAEMHKLNAFVIKEYSFGIIEGEEGLGKSLLLRWLEEGLKGQKKLPFLFIDAERIKDEEFVESMLRVSSNIFQEVLMRVKKETTKKKDNFENNVEILLSRMKNKRFLLILDNAQKLSKKKEEIIRLLSKNPKFQVILATDDIKKIDLEGKDELKIHLKQYKPDILREIIAKRIKYVGGVDLFPFEKKHIDMLIKKSGGFPSRLLETARSKAIDLSLKVKSHPPKKIEEKKETEIKEEKDIEKVSERERLKPLKEYEEGKSEEKKIEKSIEQEKEIKEIVTEAIEENKKTEEKLEDKKDIDRKSEEVAEVREEVKKEKKEEVKTIKKILPFLKIKILKDDDEIDRKIDKRLEKRDTIKEFEEKEIKENGLDKSDGAEISEEEKLLAAIIDNSNKDKKEENNNSEKPPEEQTQISIEPIIKETIIEVVEEKTKKKSNKNNKRKSRR